MKTKPKGYWTKEHCQEEALKYKSKKEFETNSPCACVAARKNGWFNEICSHMVRPKKENHPPNYWTKERVKEEVNKYEKIIDFRKYNRLAYDAAVRNGWLKEVCENLLNQRKPISYWTKEKCHEIALLYNNRSDLKNNYPNVYEIARTNGWLDEISQHMISIKKSKGYWTIERCHEIALKYETKYDFIHNDIKAYEAAKRLKCIDVICSHMIVPIKQMKNKKSRSIWTKEKLIEEALKYNSRGDFQKGSRTAYNRARKLKCLNEICLHMVKPDIKLFRCIYVYEFSDKSAYIGLTHDLHKRDLNRKSNYKDAVTKHINETGLIPQLKQLSEYIFVDIAKELESESILFYANNGWTVLNTTRGGEIGSQIKHTKEECHQEALKYNNRTDFYEKSNKYHAAACRNGWLDEICSHMVVKNKHWTVEECKELALKYHSKYHFQRENKAAYTWAIRHNILDEICAHMPEQYKPQLLWTKERCAKEALKYDTRLNFQRNSMGAYGMARKRGWLDEICSHMRIILKKYKPWTIEKCWIEVLKYKTKTQFRKGSRSAYNWAGKNNLLEDICNYYIENKNKVLSL
jgi:hypothetical protein